MPRFNMLISKGIFNALIWTYTFLMIVVFSALPIVTMAQTARSYHYENITLTADVNKDSTVTFDEKQSYNFIGQFHEGYRSIPHKDLGAITDIQVVDTATGKPLEYSSSQLDKDSPASWGKYTFYDQNGATDISWYFDEKDSNHTWDILYTVHGALGFYTDHDELYWNLFTDYDVPVAEVDAIVHTPGFVTVPKQTLYADPVVRYSQNQLGNTEFQFSAFDVPAHGKVTIAVGWQKGLVNQKAYWMDLAKMYWGFVLSLTIVLIALVTGFLHWYLTERYHKGRGTIIAEYEPPRGLRPAMGQLVATERVTESTWPATLVDLAVRGYLKIIYDKKEGTTGIGFLDRAFAKEGYVIEKTKEFNTDGSVAAYEKEFLNVLFADSPDRFSTIEFEKKMKSSTASTAFRTKVAEVTKTLFVETSDITHAYEVPLTVKSPMVTMTNSSGWGWLIYIPIVGFFALSFLADFLPSSLNQFIVFAGACIASMIGLYISIEMNPRLNQEGFLLRDDWRGFKLYLETAESYRMQNLTPETFEKFLPYAMIFKIETQWAKAFDAMNLKQPSWYGTSGYIGSSSSTFSGSGGAFSPSVFSESFASSFTSAFSSSGAGGGSGGGGSAGGGGGGGGGGAR